MQDRPSHQTTIALVPLLASIALAGCAAGPDFARPEPPTTPGFTGAADQITTAQSGTLHGGQQVVSTEAVPTEQWWQSLQSDKLNGLIDEALRNNPDITAAKATLRQSQEFYAARSGATRLPQVNVGGSAQNQRFDPGSLGMPGEAREFDLFNANVSVRYNFDLAGGNRRTLEALAARSDYQRYELDGARQTIAANVALIAITQARLAETISTMEEVLAAQRAQLRIAEGQLRLGHLSADQVALLNSDTERTAAELPLLRQQWQETAHLLAALSGKAPGVNGTPQFRMADFVLPTSLPLVVPSELVRRRSDILASEALMHAAHAEYGAAVARLYPQLNLSATLGTQASTLDGLFGPGTAIWNLLGQITQPLFSPGLKAEKRAALAAFDAAAARYQKVVLNAFREVADSLRAIENDADRLAALAEADVSAGSLLVSSQGQLRLGAASQLQVEVARQRYGRSRLALIEAQAARLSDSVTMMSAMNGSAVR